MGSKESRARPSSVSSSRVGKKRDGFALGVWPGSDGSDWADDKRSGEFMSGRGLGVVLHSERMTTHPAAMRLHAHGKTGLEGRRDPPLGGSAPRVA